MSYTLQFLHASDLEGGLEALENATNFSRLIEYYRLQESNTLLMSAGDNYIPGPFYNAGKDRATMDPIYKAVYNALYGLTDEEIQYAGLRADSTLADIVLMNLMGFDASAIGNHEFDAGPEAFATAVSDDLRGEGLADDRSIGAQFPYLSSNLDFSGFNGLSRAYEEDILFVDAFQTSLDEALALTPSSALARAALVEVGGEVIGMVGLTTPYLEKISSPGAVFVIDEENTTNTDRAVSAELLDAEMTALAALIQPVIDEVIASGVNKVVLASHLQDIRYEKALIGKLSGVDILLAGGSDSILANDGSALRAGDTAVGSYPLQTTDKDGNPALIVSTDGEYSYLGRLLVEFDESGVITGFDETSGPVATTDQNVALVTGSSELVDGSVSALVKQVVDGLQSVVAAKDAQTYGFSDVFLNGVRESVRTEETNLGTLTAKSMLFTTGAEVAIKNGGGIRAEIDQVVVDGDSYTFAPTQANPLSGKQAGQISQLDLENALRFDNSIATMNVTGAGLKALLEHGVAASGEGSTPGQFPQLAGVAFTYDMTRAAGSRVLDIALTDDDGLVTRALYQNGQAVQGGDLVDIRLATLGFLATGGDGYPFPEVGTDIQDTGIGEQAALAAYLRALHPSEDNAFDIADTAQIHDTLIQNLGVRSSSLGDATLNKSGLINLIREASVDNGGEAATEIVKVSGNLLVSTNGAKNSIDIYSVANPLAMAKVAELGLNDLLSNHPTLDVNNITSVDIKGTTVVATYQNTDRTQPGSVVAYDVSDTNNISSKVYSVGVHPDSIVMNSAGTFAYTANEGELGYQDGALVDGQGSISIINLISGAVTTIGFDGFTDEQLAGIRISPAAIDDHGSRAAAAVFDIEPEYVTLSPDESTLFVTLQENNAIARIDLSAIKAGQPAVGAEVMTLLPLGTKDHSVTGNELDASDRDGTINITNHPLQGLYLPDSIATFEVDGKTYLVTANEGDGRGDVDDPEEKGRYGDEVRAKDANIDPTVAANLDLSNSGLGRIKISATDGDIDGDGDIDVLHSFGARSFTIWSENGDLVYDSGATIEKIVAQAMPTVFNQSEGNGEFDNRSDDKGPEPEALEVFSFGGNTYLMLGLERAGASVMFDISNPEDVIFVDLIDGNQTGDIAPEEIEFAMINDRPFLFTANEVSGTISVDTFEGDPINKMYQTILGRQIDSGGNAYWSSEVDRGASLIDVARAILSSAEFDGNGLSSTSQAIDLFYEQGLGRTPDQSGFEYWQGVAASDSLAHAAVGIALSAEAGLIFG